MDGNIGRSFMRMISSQSVRHWDTRPWIISCHVPAENLFYSFTLPWTSLKAQLVQTWPNIHQRETDQTKSLKAILEKQRKKKKTCFDCKSQTKPIQNPLHYRLLTGSVIALFRHQRDYDIADTIIYNQGNTCSLMTANDFIRIVDWGALLRLCQSDLLHRCSLCHIETKPGPSCHPLVCEGPLLKPGVWQETGERGWTDSFVILY